MTKRRRHSARVMLYGPAVPLLAAGWDKAGEPLHVAGLAAAVAGWLAAVAFARLFIPSAPLGLLASRRQRVAFRHAHGREGARSAYISSRMRRIALAAGMRRCVYGIGCNGGIELDHYLPWSCGGFTRLSNLMCLCRYHNRVKSNYWVDRGKVIYHPMKGADNQLLAAAILAAERRARRNPLRWGLAALVAA